MLTSCVNISDTSFLIQIVNGLQVWFSRPVNEWRAIALSHAHTPQYLFRYAIVARAKLYMTS